MTGFVERLVVRGVGLVEKQGFVMLEPRPIARFEPIPAAANFSNLPIQDQTIDEHGEILFPSSPAVSVSHRTLQAAASASDNSFPSTFVDRWSHQATGDTPKSDSSVREPVIDHESAASSIAHEQGTLFPSPERGPGLQGPVIAPLRSGEDTSVALENNETPTGIRAVPTRIENRQDWDRPYETGAAPAFSEQLSQAGDARQPADDPPTVSIGKIEVQFVQPQPAMMAGRQALRRTCGFDSYTRARRGEPR